MRVATAVLLCACLALTTSAVAAQEERVRVVDRTRSLFPQSDHWFALVANTRFSHLPGGRLRADAASLTHPRVRRVDGAGHSIVATFPASHRRPLRIASGEDPRIWIELTPGAGADVEARIEDGLVAYAGAYRDTDVLYKSTPTHVDEYLLVTSRAAPSRWVYRVRRSAAIARLRPAGAAIEAVDRQGIPWMRAGAPFAVDRRGVRADGTVRAIGDTVVVEIDLSALEPPILVDPDWRSTGDMAYGRFYHGANVLPDGRLLATGGCTASVCSGDLTLPACRSVVRAAEALDLGSRTWSRLADARTSRFFHTAESLADGSILLAGGCTDPACAFPTATAELFDASSSSFRDLPSLPEALAGAVAVRLGDGTILVAGGCTDTLCSARAHVFDPASETFREVAPMGHARGRVAFTRLADGRVLVAGGCTSILCAGVLASAELYDPVSGTWTEVEAMDTPRAGHYVARLLDGRVLLGGGCAEQTCLTVHRSAELFDPGSGRWIAAAAEMARPRYGAVAALLPDGAVMISQGCAGDTDCDLTNELFDPSAGTFAGIESAITVRAFHQLVLHEGAGLVIANGGCQPRTCSWWNETYDVASLRPPDGGVADAGSRDGGPAWDAGAVRDGGGHDTGIDGGTAAGAGCSCRAGTRSRAPFGAGAMLIAAIVAWRTRRRGSSAALCLMFVLTSCAPDVVQPDARISDASIAADADRLDGASIDATLEASVMDGASADAPACVPACTAPCAVCEGSCIDRGAPAHGALVVSGWNQALAIDLDGALHAWGANNTGQLGLGDTRDRDVALRVGDETFTHVASGSRHSCAIRTDGALFCWGVNVHGQLGLGDTIDRLAPVRVGEGSDWIDVACGGLHTCGIRGDGLLACWGSNPAGQLGIGDASADQLEPVEVAVGYRRVVSQTRHTCAIRDDLGLDCWGDNSDGQVGVGDRVDRRTPQRVLDAVRAVRTGALHTCAIDAHGALYCWGANDHGHLGLGDRDTPRTTPVRVGVASDWAEIAAGFQHTCGARAGGELYCWGDGALGQLGIGSLGTTTSPIRVGDVGGWSSPALGAGHTCALAGDGEVRCWGDGSRGQTASARAELRNEPAPACFTP